MAGHVVARTASNALSLSKGCFLRTNSKQSPPDMFPSIPCPDSLPGLAWVYILQSADGSYYVGHSLDLHERMRKHRIGLGAKRTHDHATPRLIFYEGPMALTDAVNREAQLKRWSRAKKEALVREDVATLHALSRSREPLGNLDNH